MFTGKQYRFRCTDLYRHVKFSHYTLYLFFWDTLRNSEKHIHEGAQDVTITKHSLPEPSRSTKRRRDRDLIMQWENKRQQGSHRLTNIEELQPWNGQIFLYNLLGKMGMGWRDYDVMDTTGDVTSDKFIKGRFFESRCCTIKYVFLPLTIWARCVRTGH